MTNSRKNIDIINNFNPKLINSNNNHTYLLRSKRKTQNAIKLRPTNNNTDELMEVDQSFKVETNFKISNIEANVTKIVQDELFNLSNSLKGLLRDESIYLKNELIHIMQAFLNQLKREIFLRKK
jgi:hypothetical protein